MTDRAPDGVTFYQIENGWMETFSGGQFFFRDVKPHMIVVKDVAHSLGYKARYGGHTNRFYTVAEHSVILARYVERVWDQLPASERTDKFKDAMTMLFHDVAETYIGDMIRPLKEMFPLFKELESGIEAVAARKFDLVFPHPRWVKEFDSRILRDERTQAMSDSDNEWGTDKLEPLGVALSFWDPITAEKKFLQEFERLCACRSASRG